MVVVGKKRKTVEVLNRLNVPMAMMVPMTSAIAFQWDPRLVLLPIGVGHVMALMIMIYHLLRSPGVDTASPRSQSMSKAKSCLVFLALGSICWTGIVGGNVMSNFSSSVHATQWRDMLVIAEFLSVLVIAMFVSRSFPFTSFPIPTTFDRQWLTALFRESGLMHYSNRVANISSDTTLTGGCHSAVHKVDVSYEQPIRQLPSIMIIKVLVWDHSLIHKLLLALRSRLPRYFHNKELSYLNSYQIESRFYQTVAPQVRGLRVPQVYFNHCDRFNAHFGMILEDVARAPPGTSLTDGQPNGFTSEETHLIVSQLAHFHAQFWKHPQLDDFRVWSVGGYYTGRKRMEFKEHVEEHWSRVIEQLGDVLPVPSHKTLGARLHRNQHALNRIYEKPHLMTLVHGDFKISNIFLHKLPPSPAPPGEGREKETSVHVIDWQWVGQGCGVVDLAYFLATSPCLSMVNHDSMKETVTLYHAILKSKGVTQYPLKEVWTDFRLAFIDFLVYAICCKWTKMNSTNFRENQEAQKDGLHLRSLSHAGQLIETAEIFLDSLDLE